MEKKIRDLTEEDSWEICRKHPKCKDCPLLLSTTSCIQDIIDHLDYLSDKILDKEVEL